jgi:hypothetical protein
MKISMLYLDNGTIQSVDLGSLSNTDTTITGITFGDVASIDLISADAKTNAIPINTLPAYSSEVWLQFTKETGDTDLPHYTVYCIPKITDDQGNVISSSKLHLYYGFSADSPTNILNGGTVASSHTDNMLDMTIMNTDPSTEPPGGWAVFSNETIPYTVLQLKILDSNLPALNIQWFFKVIYTN